VLENRGSDGIVCIKTTTNLGPFSPGSNRAKGAVRYQAKAVSPGSPFYSETVIEAVRDNVFVVRPREVKRVITKMPENFHDLLKTAITESHIATDQEKAVLLSLIGEPTAPARPS
jgi:hypothetical protein